MKYLGLLLLLVAGCGPTAYEQRLAHSCDMGMQSACVEYGNQLAMDRDFENQYIFHYNQPHYYAQPFGQGALIRSWP